MMFKSSTAWFVVCGIFVLLPGFPPVAQAQSLGERFAIKEGVENTFSASGLMHNFQFVTKDESGLYLLHSISRLEGLKGFQDYYLERYDPATLGKTGSELLFTLSASGMTMSLQLLTCREYGGEVWCFFMENEGDLGVYAQRLDLSSLQLTDERVDLLREDGRQWKMSDAHGDRLEHFLPVLFSFERDSTGRDRAVFLIRSDSKGGAKGEAYYSFAVYDEHLKELWNGASDLEDRAEDFLLDEMILRPDQNELYLLTHRRLSKKVEWDKGFGRKGAKGIFWQLTGHAAGGEVWHLPVDSEVDPVLSALSFSQHPVKDELVLWAKYRKSPDPKALRFEGIFLGHFNLAKREFSLRKYTDLEPDQAEDLLWAKKEHRIEKAYEARKNFDGLDADITHAILREDGGLFLEFYTTYETTYEDHSGEFYLDLTGVPFGTAYMAVSPSGEVEWIKKTAVKLSDGLLPTFVCSKYAKVWLKEGRLYFLFTVADDIVRAAVVPLEELRLQKLPEIGVFYLSASDGQASEIEAFKSTEKDEELLYSDISKAIELGDDELLLWVSRKSEPEKYKWVRLRYKWIRKKSRL